MSDDGRSYYTAIDATFTKLFNLDLLRKVIAPRLQKQNAITHVRNFDVNRPVVLRTDLELELPDELETLCYFSEIANHRKVTFEFNVFGNKILNVFVSVLIMFVLFVYVIVRRSDGGGFVVTGAATDTTTTTKAVVHAAAPLPVASSVL